MLEWAVTHVPFGMLLKTDDDSVVHISHRQTLFRIGHASWPHLYAGHVINGTVIRPYPHAGSSTDMSSMKWSVRSGAPVSLYAPDKFPCTLQAEAICSGTVRYPSSCVKPSDGRRWLGLLPIEDAFVGVLASRAGLDAPCARVRRHEDKLLPRAIEHRHHYSRHASVEERRRVDPRETLCRRATAHARRRLNPGDRPVALTAATARHAEGASAEGECAARLLVYVL